MTILWLFLWGFGLIRFTYELVKGNRKKSFPLLTLSLDLMSFVGVLLLITSNVTGEDILNYSSKFNYDVNDDAVRERFFFFMRVTAYQLGIDFFTFRAILQSIAGIFLYGVFRHYHISFPGFLVFYLPILMFMDSMQFRNSISIWLLSWALIFIADKKKWGVLCFLIVISLLSQIHTAFIFYTILLFYPLFKKNPHFYSFVYGFVFLLSLMVLFNGNKIPFLDVIFSHVLNADDARSGIYTTSARWGFVYPTFVQIVLIFLLNWGRKFKSYIINRDGGRLVNFYPFVVFINKISLLFIPFMMTNITYYRFLRNGYFLAIISIVGLLGLISKRSQRAIFVVGLGLVTLMWVVFEIVIYDTPELIIAPVLKEGELFYNAN